MKISRKKWSFIIAIILGSVFLYWQNNDITVTNVSAFNIKIPKSFHGFRILQISDLQSKTFGQKQRQLLKEVASISPDIIVITGDLVDCNKLNMEHSMDLIKGIVNIAPIYYVSGNHENKSGVYEELYANLIAEGVTVLENEKVMLEKEGYSINLLGMSDITFVPYYEETLNMLTEELKEDSFSILLSHRPELFEYYDKANIDLTFTGHAHGGQIRLPFIGGLYAPHQGVLPAYTSGLYEKENGVMVVSRGLGNSIFPFRIFNRPELVVVTLVSEL